MIALFFASDLGFLWYNVIGCGLVVVVSTVLEALGAGTRGAPTGRGARSGA